MPLEPFVFSRSGRLVATRSMPTEEDVVASVNRFALRPLAPGEFVVFTLDLCHNGIDKHFSRFPDEELSKINVMTPGRPLMERHDLRGTLPRGTFFRSSLHREGDRLSVRPDVYVMRTRDNEDFILNIEGGVYRETSIGFSFETPECSICGKDLRACDHVPGRSYGDTMCHYVMRNVLEVIEGSVVSSGSQGTGFVGTGPRESASRALPLETALDRARRAYHEPLALWSKRLWSDE
ncbi:MAG: hypothetical protein K1Y02_17870 [Candidatus Hydrogenedentes bacterium]|nr:hypothetical protein [Candidatus Hydrogenedentota bacterium]